ncbi:MAG: hypothetical protein IJ173_03720 [Kiritimatiellae bacterium]|nr:hypothetical protein [Kiritimatiellia bacterium]
MPLSISRREFLCGGAAFASLGAFAGNRFLLAATGLNRVGRPRIWVNALWDSLSANHSDRAALVDPEANWGWWLDNGVTMIQSDYAAELIVWLTQKGRRNF